MATAASVVRHSMGDLTMHIIKLTSIGTADTYASNIPGVIEYWMRVNGAGGGASADTGANLACAVSLSAAATGTFTFYPFLTATTGVLYVLSTS